MACLGAGQVEEEYFNIQGVQDIFEMYGRYIDDIFSLFNGDQDKCNDMFNILNSLYTGKIKVTWEFSDESVIFLNMEIFINRDKKIIETKYYVKPSNQRLFLNYRSNHPKHVFNCVVYSMALIFWYPVA